MSQHVLAALSLCGAAAALPAYLDYAIQDVCQDSAGNAIPGDPFNCTSHRDINIGEKSPYLRSDFDRTNGQRYQALFSFPVAGTDGALKVMTTKAMDASQLNLSFTFSFDKTRDGYDLMDVNAGPTVSFIRTSDGGCYDQKISLDADHRRDGWILYGQDVGDGSSTHNIRLDRISPDRPASCAAVAEDTSGSTQDVWNHPVTLTFESGKALSTIVTYHFANKNLGQTNNALERYFFTREYGFTRWEAWVPLARCIQEHGAMDPSCDPTNPNNMLRGRCGAAGPIKGTDSWGGVAWVRLDCRDSTDVLQLLNPVLALTPEMARNDGLVDIVYPADTIVSLDNFTSFKL